MTPFIATGIGTDTDNAIYSTPITSLDDVSSEHQSSPPIKKTLESSLETDNIGDPFWGDDFAVLFRKDRLVEFFPTSDQTLPERINSLTRLIMYISVVLSIYQNKATAVHFGLLLLAMLYVMYKNQTIYNTRKVKTNTDDASLETFENVEETPCTMPTLQNPFMNFMMGDVPGKAPACKGPGIQETAANLLDKQLFMDVDDLYSRNANQRLFRTMPETTGVPDREKYANWLVGGEKGCKTSGDCVPFEDLRYQRQLIPEDVVDDQFNVTGFDLNA